MSETHEQIAVVSQFRWQYPNDLIYAVPNGTFLHGTKLQRERQMIKLKKEGLEPGIPDLCIPTARGGYFGLYIEMKDRNKTETSLSKLQALKLKYLKAQGYKSIWCAGASTAIKVINDYMKMKRTEVVR